MSTPVYINQYPALVLFFGMEGCPACGAWSRTFRATAERHPRVPSFAVDCEKQPVAADRFGVKVTPTTFLVSNGRVLLKFEGDGSPADAEKLFRHAEGIVQQADDLAGAGWRR